MLTALPTKIATNDPPIKAASKLCLGNVNMLKRKNTFFYFSIENQFFLSVQIVTSM